MARPRIVFNHVGLCVADTARSRRFYEGLLGFTYWWELEPPDEGTGQLLQLDKPIGLHATYLVRDGLVLELLAYSHRVLRAGSDRVMDQVGLTHLSLSVSDLGELLAAVERFGGSIVEGNVTDKSAMVRDPDGQLLELLGRVARCPAAAPRRRHECNDLGMTPAADPVDADPDPHIVLGIIGDPGAAFSLARELADTELHCELDQRLPGARWCVEVMEHRLVQPPATDAQIVKAARKTLLEKGWDVVICLTDLPLHVDQRPVVAHANPVRNVAIVSVPALGAMGGRHRIRETIVRLLVRLIAGSAELHHSKGDGGRRSSRRLTVQRVRELGSDPADEAFLYTARVLTGNLTLISGMVAANQPWRLSLRLSRALTGAVAAGVFGLVTADIWRLADAFGLLRLAGTALVSVSATVVTLIVGAELWEPMVARAVRKQVILFNIVTVITVLIGVTVLYVALYVLALGASFWFVMPQIWRDQVGHPATLRDYFELAWLISSLAMIGGALGAALESDDAVREAASSSTPTTRTRSRRRPDSDGSISRKCSARRRCGSESSAPFR